MVNKIIRLVNFRLLALIIVLLSIIISIPRYYWAPFPGTSDYIYHYTHYNNFLLFKYSFYHLIQHKDLYLGWPGERHYDLFKYSPAFAFLMAPIAILPNLLGLIVWTALNGLILFYAFWKFPFKNDNYRLLAIVFVFPEAITSMEIFQSNCLVVGLIILAYLAIERKNIAIAAMLIIASAFIKLFGIAALVIFLFYPNKAKAALWTFIWLLVFAFLPLLVITPTELLAVYHSWVRCLSEDYSVSYGFSVMGWLYTWFGINAKSIIMLIGIILFLIPLLRIRSFHNAMFRQLFLASILIWMIIFNYKSESPTFIIAVSGIAIWFFTQEYKPINLGLLLFALVFTILSATDLFPKSIRDNYMIPFVVKVIPCTIIWIKVIYDLLTTDFPGSAIKPLSHRPLL